MMNYLKRRFSSGDLQNENDDNTMTMPTSTESHMNMTSQSNVSRQSAWESRSSKYTSAPSSPTRSLSFANQFMNAARGVVHQAIQQIPHQQTGTPLTSSSSISYSHPQHHHHHHHHSQSIQNKDQQQPISKEKFKLLLVIDDQHTDWSKYFKGKKIFADYDIRVEQAEFKDINLAAYSDAGTLVDINIYRNGTHVVRSFRPDFVLVRQYVKDINIDWTNIILGMQYGALPGVNSMKALYNFRDKPWIFAELLNIQRRLGTEQFPLISQAYYPNYREMLISPQFPSVVKVGQAHQGLGKIRVENPYDYQDLTSVVAISNCYTTVEPYIDGRCDVYVQKIGQYYKAFIRKSLTGNWKANTGSAMLEQIEMTDRYRLWIDEVSQLFGGLDMCAIEIVQSKDGKEYIVQVNDCCMQLLGESQDEDRRCIAELVMHKMQIYCRPDKQPTMMTRVPSVEQPIHELPKITKVPSPLNDPMPAPTTNTQNISSSTTQVSNSNRRELPNVPRNTTNIDNQSSSSISQNPFYNASTTNTTNSISTSRSTPSQWMGNIGHTLRKQTSNVVDGGDSANKDESEDTLANLKKTFAGIFGDMMS
ncbi:unnamed protein product [Rotaria sp. Silwood1]|nr:unnamed protein product [Rotaria sp. Silwood1]CAF0861306.1 unnamed protein product [Rotaria sp. Silwood1]CAF3364846.1 unnamed protein product [Rotaria sp. Silwood1]CAF3387620.1 unnamed protein product [Rotaria sp. Silwood1]CAF4569010.1 unnamed protein product [Rotaria sp. Silwood1]